MIIKTTTKGQLVIPARLRKDLGIRPGQKMSVEREGGSIVLRPLPDDPVEALRGMLVGEPLTDQLEKERRAERGRPQITSA